MRNTRTATWATARLMGGAALGVLASMALAGTASAQDNAPAEQDDGALTEIIVSAQRYEQRLQDTPLSVVAVDAEQLESQGVSSLQGFDSFIPNLTIGGTPNNGNAIANFAIRGIGGSPSGLVTQEGAVGVYVDDILFARPNGALLELLDVERVEVLRGPQGTLFGRNTPAGAIRYVTRKPEFDEIEGNVKGVVGSNEWRDVSAVLNVPLSDTIAARLSYANNRRGGYVSRVIDDIKTGDQNSSTFRAQLRWKPTSRLDINASFDSIRTHDNGAPTIIPSYTVTDIHPTALYNNAATGAAALNRDEMRGMVPSWVSPSNYTDAQGDINYYTSQVRGDSQVYGGFVPDRNTFKSTGGSLGIEYELTDDITFKSLTGYRDLSQYMQLDYDRTPLPYQYMKEWNDVEYLTQEFQLQGSSFDNKLKWIGGFFYYYDHATNNRRRFDPSTGTTSASAGEPEGITGGGFRESRDIRTKSIAFFGQATLEVTDRLSATAGLRWSKDNKNYTAFRDGRGRQVANGPSLPGNVKGQWTSLSPRFALDYKWTDAIMTYASVAKGFKAGGFNDTLQTNCFGTQPLANCGLQEYKPENLWTYEAGVRTELFDRRVRFNLTGFYTDYKAQQINLTNVGPPPVQYFVNGDSVVKGIEADLMIAAGRNLILRGGFGYVEGSYSEVINGLYGTPAVTPDMPFYRNPKYSYNIGATYTREVAEGEASLDLNWGFKDRQFSFPSTSAGTWLPSYGLLNARLGYEHKSGWSVALIANNLTDKRYFTNGFDSSGPATKATPGLPTGSHDTLMGYSTYDLGRPREFAFEAKYKF